MSAAATKELAQHVHDTALAKLGTDAKYFVLWRPFNDELAANVFVSNFKDKKRLADWLRHVADGIERSA